MKKKIPFEIPEPGAASQSTFLLRAARLSPHFSFFACEYSWLPRFFAFVSRLPHTLPAQRVA